MKLANLHAAYLPSLDPYSRYALNGNPALRGRAAAAATNRGNLMEKNEKRPTRKHGTHLRVPVLAHEKIAIVRQADAAGLTIAAYLRNVGLGYEIHGVLDYRCVEDMARVNGDLGRMGGLLKLWLTNDERITKFGPVRVRAIILRVLAKIERNQDELHKIIKTIIAS